MARKLVTLLVIASFATLVFAFAGCGGDDESASGDTTTTETTTTEETEDTDTETTDTETTETTETEDTETTDTTDTCDDSDFATSENCQEFAQIGAEISTALTGARGRTSTTSRRRSTSYAAAAPEEIKEDFEAIADYIAEVADALEGVDFSSGQTPSPDGAREVAVHRRDGSDRGGDEHHQVGDGELHRDDAVATTEERRDALVGRLFEAALGAMDLFGVYVGDRLGLYRALADAGPLTSSGLAEAAGVHERYAREWLEQQAATGILEVDDVAAAATERRFSLPAAMTRSCSTRRASTTRRRSAS